ncbi:hypothetical protein D3C72_2083830 [compost metagenome]
MFGLSFTSCMESIQPSAFSFGVNSTTSKPFFSALTSLLCRPVQVLDTQTSWLA